MAAHCKKVLSPLEQEIEALLREHRGDARGVIGSLLKERQNLERELMALYAVSEHGLPSVPSPRTGETH
jgi:hypothetical protein